MHHHCAPFQPQQQRLLAPIVQKITSLDNYRPQAVQLQIRIVPQEGFCTLMVGIILREQRDQKAAINPGSRVFHEVFSILVA